MIVWAVALGLWATAEQELAARRIEGDEFVDPTQHVLTRNLEVPFRSPTYSAAEWLDAHPQIASQDLFLATATRPFRFRGLPSAYLDIELNGISLQSGAFSTGLLSLLGAAGVGQISLIEGGGSLQNPGVIGTIALQERPTAKQRLGNLTLAMGSQWQRRVHLRAQHLDAQWQASVGLHHRGSQGDFVYYNDRATDRIDDDRLERRGNNDAQGQALQWHLASLTGWRPTLSGVLAVRDFGIAGRSQQSLRATRGHTAEGVVGLSLHPSRDWQLSGDLRLGERRIPRPLG